MNQSDFFKRYKYNIEDTPIGEGGFGTVYKVFDDQRGESVAMKISTVKIGKESLSLQREVELASKIPGHKNIAHYKACYRFTTPHGIFDYGILQFYPAGNLSQLIKKEKLTFEQKVAIAKGIIEGVSHLHRHHIVHRDLKCSNILMSQDYKGEFVPKIADFGLSKEFAPIDFSFSNSFIGGSLYYAAPEQLAGNSIRKNVDIWSLGVILFELFTGFLPFLGEHTDNTEHARTRILHKINNAIIPDSINSIDFVWQDIIKKCLVVDPNKRILDIDAIKKMLNMTIEESDFDITTKDYYVEKTSKNKKQTEIDGSRRNKSVLRNRKWMILMIALLLGGWGSYFIKKSTFFTEHKKKHVDHLVPSSPRPIPNKHVVPKKRKKKKLKLLTFICKEKNDVTGFDEIYIKVDGETYIDNRKTQSGDIVDLSFIPAMQLDTNTTHTITVLEEDLFVTHTLVTIPIKGDNYKRKKYTKIFTWANLLGKYEVIYEIQ